MTARRRARATWENDLKNGHGTVKGDSGALPQVPITWAARTEEPGGKTSPEELLAAAHAACFAMAFTATLGRMGKTPERVGVTATCTFDKVGEGWGVTTMDLDVTGHVPGMTSAQFAEAAQTAEKGCPISVAICNNVAIKVNAKLD
jgi:osmotically inducible protein OsmC